MRDDNVRAAAYQRISHIAELGDEHGVSNQRDDQTRLAKMRGYQVVMSEADNDLSAYNGERRPGYERIMAAVSRGEVDAVLVFQLSRFWRNRVERAHGIEVLRKHGVSIIATRGPSLDLSNAYGRAMVDVLGAFDTMESEVKGERQQLAEEQRARAGKPRMAAWRPFGWQADRRTPDPAEGAAVAAACTMLLSGATVTEVIRDWERRGVRPLQAKSGKWTRASVQMILGSPRIAGISVYKGIELGPGEWEPLVAEETFRAVAWLLRHPRRPPPRGAVSLLGHLALCRCGNYVSGTVSSRGTPGYRCNQATQDGRRGPHVYLGRAEVDEHVSAAVVAWLSQPDVARLVTGPQGGDADILRDEETLIHARLAQLGSMFVDGTATEADVTSGRIRGEQRLGEIHARLAQLGSQSALTPLILAESTAQAWSELVTGQRRAVVAELMTVTLYPPGPGRRFNPAVVLPPGKGIVWKEQR